MSKWEVCTIEMRSERKWGLFRKTVDISKYVAVVDKPEGPKVISESRTWKYIHDDSEHSYSQNREQDELSRTEHSKLVGKLLEDGWEPINGDTFRRQVP